MRAYTRPLMVSQMGEPDQACRALEELSMKAGRGEGSYNELWLQKLIQEHPALLPIGQIEPGLAAPVPVCMELRLPSGFVDNLMLTPDGGIVVVETKLWRNPEARREVVGQILDYAKDLSRFSYEDLERQVQIARREPSRLFELVCAGEATAEAPFIDAVSRNLKLGRFLLIMAGDGVQESAELLSDFLQRHVGLHFTLAMVEMSLWRAPEGGDVLVQPRVLAKTVQIERAVVRLEEDPSRGRLRIEPLSAAASVPLTLSAASFYDQLAANEPSAPAQLKALIERLEPLGVRAEVAKGLRIKWASPSGRDLNLGYVDPQGRFFTDTVHISAEAIGRGDLGQAYKRALAQLIPGATTEPAPAPQWVRLTVHRTTPKITSLLEKAEGFIAAITAYVSAVSRCLPEEV